MANNYFASRKNSNSMIEQKLKKYFMHKLGIHTTIKILFDSEISLQFTIERKKNIGCVRIKKLFRKAVKISGSYARVMF